MWFFKNYNQYGDDDYPKEEVPKDTHKWVDTGLRKTWCKNCNAEGYYEMGKVKTASPFCRWSSSNWID